MRAPKYLALVSIFSVGVDTAEADWNFEIQSNPAYSAESVLQPADLLPSPPHSWQIECEGKSPQHYGNHLVDSMVEVDPTRCVRFVSATILEDGDFQLSADGVMHQLGRPYLEGVAGDLRIDSNVAAGGLDEVYLPRLKQIQGNVRIDLNPDLEYVDLSQMVALNRLEVKLRPMNSDLSGLDSVTNIDRLVIDYVTPNNDVALNGLNGVTTLGSLKISGFSVYMPGQPAGQDQFLQSLTQVSGEVRIEGNGLDRLYGLASLQSVGGDLLVSEQVGLTDLTGLDALQSVAGTLALDGVAGLTSVAGLGTLSVGSLLVRDAPVLSSLSGFAALSIAGGTAIFENTPMLPCSEIQSFASNHPSVTVIDVNSGCAN